LLPQRNQDTQRLGDQIGRLIRATPRSPSRGWRRAKTAIQSDFEP